MVNSVLYQLSKHIKAWGLELGFADVGISDTDLSAYEPAFLDWLKKDYHGEMQYMAAHGTKRSRPNALEPATASIISVRLNYFDGDAQSAINELQQSDQGYISRYALHKDYHKLMRKRLQQLAERIETYIDEHNLTPLLFSAASHQPNPTQELEALHTSFQYRAFCDSAPVLERPIAEQAGLGFVGKNSLVIHPRAGSWFFLGELYCNLALPADPPFKKQGCGPCTACIDECPTGAIVDNAVVDARRCISYLTIEHPGAIDPDLRPLMGNRIYGCDDCQLVCPWNHFTQPTHEQAFKAQHHSPRLDKVTLKSLLSWTEQAFLKRLEGSPIRRIGYERWQRNLCIAIGNDCYRPENEHALSELVPTSDMVNEHRLWALERQHAKKEAAHKNTARLNDQRNTFEQKAQNRFATPGKPAIAPKYYLPKSPK